MGNANCKKRKNEKSRGRKKRSIINYIFIYISYVLIALFFFFPILWTVSLSFKTASEVFHYPPKLIPNNPTVDNYITVFKNTSMPEYILNSFKLVLLTVIGTLLITIPGAYALSRYKIKYKNVMLYIILLFQMISAMVIIVPIYQYYAKMNWINNYFALAAIYVATQIPFTTWLLKGYFDCIPIDLEEAARIDGASKIKTLLSITLPIAKTGISSAVIFISINAWSQFILPFILIDKSNKFPVSVGILLAQGTYQQISIHYVAAASVIALLPAIILVLIMQKFIVESMVAGAIKG